MSPVKAYMHVALNFVSFTQPRVHFSKALSTVCCMVYNRLSNRFFLNTQTTWLLVGFYTKYDLGQRVSHFPTFQ